MVRLKIKFSAFLMKPEATASQIAERIRRRLVAIPAYPRPSSHWPAGSSMRCAGPPRFFKLMRMPAGRNRALRNVGGQVLERISTAPTDRE